MLETTGPEREVIDITGGVDTHADTHTVAALDGLGRLLGHATFPATVSGFHELLTGWSVMGLSSRWGWKGQAPTGPASSNICAPTASGSSRSTSLTGVRDAIWASPTRPTQSLLLEQCRQERQPGPRRPATGS